MTTNSNTADQVATINDLVIDKYVNKAITDDQIKEAIAAFKQLFPNDSNLAAVSETELQQRVSDFLKNNEVFTPDLTVSSSRLALVTGESCPTAIAVVIVDCVFMVLGFVGLHASYSEAVQRDAANVIVEDVARDLPGWRKLIDALRTAQTPQAKAVAIFNIARAAYRAGMIRGILAEIVATMTWWDWTITGVAALAQIAALFLTDGAAFIAEVVLNTTAVAYVVSDSVKVYQACGQYN